MTAEDEVIARALEILDRRMRANRQPIGKPGEAVISAALQLAEERVESLMVVWLETSDRVIGVERMGQGGIDELSFIPRELARKAVLTDARGAVVIHNHPPGDVKPSPEDKQATDRLRHCLAAVGCMLMGSYVVARGRAACVMTGQEFELADLIEGATA